MMCISRLFCLKRKKTLVTVKDKTPAQLLEDMRSDFVANVSHELRSPLTNLIGFIETLRDGANDDAPDQDMQAHFLGIMSAEAARMSRLINDLLSLSQQVADSHILPEGEIDFLELMQDACTSVAPKLKKMACRLYFLRRRGKRIRQSLSAVALMMICALCW